MLLQEQTRKEIQFQALIKKLTKQSNDLELNGLKRVFELINNAGNRIISQISLESIEGWDATHLPRILDALTGILAEFRSQYSAQMQALQAQGFDLGMTWVDDLLNLQAKGNISAELQLSSLPQLSTQSLAIWQGYSSKLIVNITEELRKNIDTVLTMGITGEKGTYELIKEIGKLPNFRQATLKQEPYKRIVGTPMEKIWTRAEYITRTELNRIASIATKSRQDQIKEKFPEAKKYWLQSNKHNPRLGHSDVEAETNPDYGGTPILLDEQFILIAKDGTTYYIDSPHDSRLPAGEVINCGCRSVTTLPELEEY